MRSSSGAWAFFAAAALALACSVPARAQMHSGGMGGMGGGGGGGRGTRDAQTSDAAASARSIPASEALYDARTRLLITQEQSVAWERFYQAYLRWSPLVATRRAAPEAEGAMQAMQGQLAFAQARLAATQELSDAAGALLPSLTESQRQVADTLIPQLLALTSASGQRIVPR